MTQERRDERSLGELFGELARETGTLVRQEVQLAKTEMTQKVSAAGKDAAMIGAGAAVAYAGLLALVAAAVIGLAYFIPLWLSALIVGLILVAGGYMAAQSGLSSIKRINPKPEQTIQTLKEDTEWVKEQTR